VFIRVYQCPILGEETMSELPRKERDEKDEKHHEKEEKGRSDPLSTIVWARS